jgi:glycosyltransferase involved in cell wall biosynthesis
MKVLFLAPQPFYEDRGTPIAESLLLNALSQRGEEIDLVTYHLGEDVEYENVNIHRIRNIPFIRTVPLGFSLVKLICDFLLFWKVVSLLVNSKYNLIHAVEESVFMAFVLKKIWGIEYIYDMDSSLPAQLLDKYPFLSPLNKLFLYLERVAVKNAKLILPVSPAMVENLEYIDLGKTIVLNDVSLLQNGAGEVDNSIREEMDFSGILVMYIGNLEIYQGIDLLLESFTNISRESNSINLAIIGGETEDIQRYEEIAQELGIATHVRFFGPKPMNNLGGYLSEADILVSPRISGDNTPMKIYSFLESGKAIVATNLRTHTQVLDKHVAVLTEPTPKDFAEGVLLVAGDEDLRVELGKNGKKLALEKYTYEEFQSTVNRIYDSIDPVLTQELQEYF